VGVEQPIGAPLSRDISRSEAMETDLDNLIARRHDARVSSEGDRAEEAAWVESTRVYNEKRRQQARHEWHLHHTSQAERLRRTLESLIEHHEEKAQELITPQPGDAA
jgi:hypothetical protein